MKNMLGKDLVSCYKGNYLEVLVDRENEKLVLRKEINDNNYLVINFIEYDNGDEMIEEIDHQLIFVFKFLP